MFAGFFLRHLNDQHISRIANHVVNHPAVKNPVCIVFDYSRTLSQKEFPVGLRSLLIREYGDDTAHDVSGLNTFIR
ncbi:TPA: hypothetical protein GE142_17400 [Escherichia coli]|nr:hypothetical protein [Escherichia coli]